MLRSVLVAAFSVGVAFGVVSGFSEAKGDVLADSVWPPIVAQDAPAGDSVWAAGPARTDDSVWA
ncbi:MULTISPECIES: hypothetical protein [Streptomyces]|uniref:Uncharacterized protein n=2 Tax=Streptomyces TaxID=1883 RepID=A0ABU2PU23_9ACTN|nr:MULTISPECIES: hypothetical protein [unclassified Streptomyces]MDT0394260.1 hypothetical protein [Streptomyces sp. DSM 41636]MDT0405743.1 hypothetical protein [Streptomyces sp. DSM 41635]